MHLREPGYIPPFFCWHFLNFVSLQLWVWHSGEPQGKTSSQWHVYTFLILKNGFYFSCFRLLAMWNVACGYINETHTFIVTTEMSLHIQSTLLWISTGWIHGKCIIFYNIQLFLTSACSPTIMTYFFMCNLNRSHYYSRTCENWIGDICDGENINLNSFKCNVFGFYLQIWTVDGLMRSGPVL